MALTLSKAKANIQRHFYVVYMRETGTACAATDYDTLAHWNTFLALFTEIGYCENKNVKIDVERAEPIEIDEGEEYFLEYTGSTEIKYVQNDSTDHAALEDMASKDCDLLLVSSSSAQFIYVHNKRFNVEQHIISGDVEHAIIKHSQRITALSGTNGYIHTIKPIPAA